jgi:hypothetical protein
MQSQFLALVDVGRARQRQQDHDRRSGTTLSELAVQPRRGAIGQQPSPRDLLGETMIFQWQPVPSSDPWRVVATQQPAGGRASSDHVLKPGVDHVPKVIGAPVRILHGEIECLPKTFGCGVSGSSRGMHGGFGDRIPRRIVRVEDAPPVSVDLMDVVAIPERM